MNPTHRRTRASVAGLLGLNAALLGVMAFVTFAAPVIAQFRPRGSYHAAVGSAPGAAAGVIYVVDEVNQQLIAFTWDPNTKKLVGIGGTDLALDASRVGGRN